MVEEVTPQGFFAQLIAVFSGNKVWTPALNDSHFGPLREACGAFQRHSNIGGKLKPGWSQAESLPLFSLFYSLNQKGIWSDVYSDCSDINILIKKHPWKTKKQHWLPACLLVTWSFNLSRSFPLHVARLISIHEDCNFNLSGIHLPDGYRYARRHLGNKCKAQSASKFGAM